SDFLHDRGATRPNPRHGARRGVQGPPARPRRRSRGTGSRSGTSLRGTYSRVGARAFDGLGLPAEPGNDLSEPLRFHWSLSQAGNPTRRALDRRQMSGRPNLAAAVELCRLAERHEIASVLMAIGYVRPDPLLLALAIGAATSRIGFMVACRSGLIAPSAFVHQINSASSLLPDRILINMVCGHTPHELR